MLDDVGVGQATFLVTGLPPFLRGKDLRARNRGEVSLALMRNHTCLLLKSFQEWFTSAKVVHLYWAEV